MNIYIYIYYVCVHFSSKHHIAYHLRKRATGGIARAPGRLLRLRGALPRSPEAPGGPDGRDQARRRQRVDL